MQIGITLMDQVTSLENMMLAWRKLERAFNYGDVWYDELLIAEFKMNLVDNLQVLAAEMKNGNYKMQAIRPIPFPKGGTDKDNQPKVRQSFFIDFRDQLAWMAVCNVIGHIFDRKMPAWSFGNRLYVSMWMEKDEEGNKIWKVGNYRNTSRNFYRKWTQSWPLMRRRITASLKKMAGLKEDDLDELEKQTHKDNTALSESQKYLQLPYLEKGYFEERKTPLLRLFWAGIDLTKFYQQVMIAKVEMAMLKEIKTTGDDSINELIATLCNFEVDYNDYGYEGGDENLNAMQLEKDKKFEGLPTGLIVAGFLANIFMIEIDAKVGEKLDKNHDVIHFRYVDDHVIIATDTQKLFDWTAWYQKLLAEYGLKVNIDKLAPDGISNKLKERGRDLEGAFFIADYEEDMKDLYGEMSAIDPFFPTPLMTQTLQKVSQLQGLHLNMLSAKEFAIVFSELQSLLVADLSEQEIKKSTRISFACTMLSRLIVDGEVDYENVKRFRLAWLNWLDEEYKKRKNAIEKGEGNNKKEEIGKLDELYRRLTLIVFDEVEQIDTEKLKKEYPMVADHLWPLEKLSKTLKAGEQLTASKERQIFNMLMHALDDVPDKVRVWIRAMGYCVKHQPYQVGKLYEKLNKYEETKKLHSLSVEYLRGLLDLLRADHVIRATYRLLTDEYQYSRQKKQDMAFLKEAFKVKPKAGKLFISEDAQFMMRKAASFYNLHREKFGLREAAEEEWFFNESLNYHHCERLDSTFWLQWVVTKLKYWKRDERPVITETMRDYFGEASPESPYYKAFFMAYLREVCLTEAAELALPKELNNDVEWYNDEIKYVLLHLPKATKLKGGMLTEADKKALVGRQKSRQKVNVIQWIEAVKKVKSKNERHSLLHSEMLAVMMELAIINVIKKQGEDFLNVVPHPDNFRFYIEDVLNSDWNTILGKVNKETTLRAEYFPNRTLKGDSYCYPTLLDGMLPKPLTLCYGLGLIFLQMLSKRSILPWTLNTQEAGYDWQRILHDLQGKGQISSLNYRIVNACLSPRQRENWRLNKILADEYIEETFMDRPRIQTVENLETELRLSLRSLEENLISVANEEHRQLIVIDLL